MKTKSETIKKIYNLSIEFGIFYTLRRILIEKLSKIFFFITFPLITFLNIILNCFGYACIRKKDMQDFYLHEYKSYDDYKKIQIFHNKRKISRVWADKKTLTLIANILLKKFGKSMIKGICHGSRNGFEQNFFSEFSSNIRALGTDISETSKNFKNSVHWDFHDQKEEWVNSHEFVYSNSLDQSYYPEKALVTWINQLNKRGILIIEHSEVHGPKSASEMDPFGVRPTALPFYLIRLFGSQINISYKSIQKENKSVIACVYIISKNVLKVRILENENNKIIDTN